MSDSSNGCLCAESLALLRKMRDEHIERGSLSGRLQYEAEDLLQKLAQRGDRAATAEDAVEVLRGALEGGADKPPAITHEAIYHVCGYLNESGCGRCPDRVETPYGPGQPGCFAVAKEHITVALTALGKHPSVCEGRGVCVPGGEES